MHLYLSSYKIGDHSKKLLNMFVRRDKVAVVPNALDFTTDLERKEKSIQGEIDSLKELGLEPEVLDLKNYFGKEQDLEQKLKKYKGVWVRGGNVFVLRVAFQKSGFDNLLKKRLNSKEFVYGGYSAGCCILSPSLKGYEIVDPVDAVQDAYKNEKVNWSGLNIINFAFEPHYKSEHSESADIDKEITYLIENKILFKAFKDGEVYTAKTHS